MPTVYNLQSFQNKENANVHGC